MPNYNNSEYVEKAVRSVLSQSLKNIELIVVDDRSTDNSLDILKELQKTDSRLSVIQNERNVGVSKTRDNGIKHANSDIITTLDSDDILLSTNKLEQEYKILETHQFDKYVIAFSGIQKIDKYDSVVDKLNSYRKVKEGRIYEELLTRACLIPRDFMFSKHAYDEVGGFDFDIPIYEDWDLKIRLSKIAKYIYTGIPGIGYRQLSTGLSSVKKVEHERWIDYVFNKNTYDPSLKTVLSKNMHHSFLKKVRIKAQILLFNLKRQKNG